MPPFHPLTFWICSSAGIQRHACNCDSGVTPIVHLYIHGAAPAKVRVHVPFPQAPSPIDENGRPDIQHAAWDWIPCLEIPVNLLNSHHFSVKPYKWIRYATGVVVGARGHLSPNADLIHDLDDNAAHLENDAGDLELYYMDDVERQRMFPTDPQMANEKTTSSVMTSRRGKLREDLLERDTTCVLTDGPADACDGVHLIAHSKGDQYISTFTTSRSRDPHQSDHISAIDSVRNALLLNKLTHIVFGKDIAFLVTPNFAMDACDVERAAPGVPRCTAHLFSPARDFFLAGVESGHAVRVAPRDWPPDILFDAVYASAIMEHFSAPDFKTTCARTWKNRFYPEGIPTSRQADQKKLKDEQRLTLEKREIEKPEPDNFDLLMMVPYINFSDDQSKVFLETTQERARVAGRERVEAKVDTWRQQLSD